MCDCYKHPDPIYGPTRNLSYMEAVRNYLGKNHQFISSIVVHESLYGNGIAYTITAAASVRYKHKDANGECNNICISLILYNVNLEFTGN
ncbi:hypothetical protein SAY86_006797 [Trapa natans]|uniref:Uncharacterized protein n=1 Tax=Trapa natans TaxID=22666 RepID=A0AAN7QTK7_TRANT|nr:hypothetical protein SAY86_006797 [Trapa natans]